MNKSKQNIRCFVITLSALCLLLFVGGCGSGADLPNQTAFDYHEGDIVFQSLPRNALVNVIEGTTKSEWSHCGVVMRERGEWVVYEALGSVRYTPLPKWVERGRSGGKYEVYRLKSNVAFDVENLRTHLMAFWGRPYDFHYAPDDSAIYCSELVYKAYERAEKIQIGTWETLGSLNWKPFERFILTIESSVPMDRSMITPVGLTRSELVDRVYVGKAK